MNVNKSMLPAKDTGKTVAVAKSIALSFQNGVVATFEGQFDFDGAIVLKFG
jgi:hypothetical protein